MGAPAIPAPPDNNAGMAIQAMMSADKTRTMAGAAVSLAQIQSGKEVQQSNNMLFLGMEAIGAGKEVKLAKIEASLEKAEMKHDKAMADTKNDELALKLDKEDSDTDFFDGGNNSDDEMFN